MNCFCALFVLLFVVEYADYYQGNGNVGFRVQATCGATISIENANFMGFFKFKDQQNNYVPQCSACIVKEEHDSPSTVEIMASARCLRDQTEVDFFVGEANSWNDKAIPHEKIKREQWHIPLVFGKQPLFSYFADIAIIKLNNLITFNKTVGGLVLADKNYKLEPEKMYEIYGYGSYASHNQAMQPTMDHLRFIKSKLNYEEGALSTILRGEKYPFDHDMFSNIPLKLQANGNFIPHLSVGDAGGAVVDKENKVLVAVISGIFQSGPLFRDEGLVLDPGYIVNPMGNPVVIHPSRTLLPGSFIDFQVCSQQVLNNIAYWRDWIDNPKGYIFSIEKWGDIAKSPSSASHPSPVPHTSSAGHTGSTPHP